MDIAGFMIDASAVLCVSFGLYILTRDYRNSLYRLFMLLCIIISAMALITGRIFTVTSREDLFFWDRVYALFAFIYWAVNLHFYLLLTGKKIREQLQVLLYLPAVILIFLEFTSFPLVTDFARQGNRWKYIYSGTYYVYMVYSISYALADMVLLYRWSRKGYYKKHRLQGRAILSATIILWAACITTDYILSHFAFYAFPPTGAIGRMIYAFIIWYSFVKYRFLDSSISSRMDEIVRNYADSVALLNPDLTIRKYSRKLNSLLKTVDKQITGRSILEFSPDNEELKDKLDQVKTGKAEHADVRLNFKTAQGRITADCQIYGIPDKFGDVEIILMKLNENRNVENFSDVFNLSERQMEIITLALRGLTNTEISQKLNISKKTTEVHFFNIYNKLGINSKIELYNMGIEYNLLLKNPVPVEAE